MDDKCSIERKAKIGQLQQPIHSGFGETSTAKEVLKGISLTGKTIIITGGHSGIGLEGAKALTAAGARVVIGARDIEKAKAALESLKNVSVIELDLAEPKSVDRFADEYLQAFKSCDVLINNAGIMATPLSRNSLGHELQFAINHLGHFRLTARLWEVLIASKARIVNLSSLGHRFSGIKFDDPNFLNTPYDKWIAYGQSKTANSLFTVQLDLIGRAQGVRAFAVHPGRITSTNLSRHMTNSEVSSTANSKPADPKFVPSFVKSVEQGAATSIWCATNAKLQGMGGVYCANCDVSPLVADESSQTDGVRRWAVDAEMAARLWTLSEELNDLKFK